MKIIVDNKLIQKRQQKVCSTYNKDDCKVYFERALNSENTGSRSLVTDIRTFFKECCYKANANRYYPMCLGFIKSFESKNSVIANELINEFTTNILPYVDNLTKVLSIANGYHFSSPITSKLIQSIKEYKACDRIIKNHNILNEKIDIDRFVYENRNKAFDRLIPLACTLITEVSRDLSLTEQFNICLDELSYTLERHYPDYDKDNLVQYVTEYFLKDPYDEKQRNAYIKILFENSMISDKDIRKVKYFTEFGPSLDDIYDKSFIDNKLKAYLNMGAKDLNVFGHIIRDVAVDRFFCYEVRKVLAFIRNNIISNNTDMDHLITIIDSIVEGISSNVYSRYDANREKYRYTRDNIRKIISQYEDEINYLVNVIDDYKFDKEYQNNLIIFRKALIKSVDDLNELYSGIYTDYNIDAADEISNINKTAESMDSDMYKSRILKGLLNNARQADRDIRTKYAPKLESVSKNISLIESPISYIDEETYLENVIPDRNVLNIVLETFMITNKDGFGKVHDVLSSICRNLNEDALAKAYGKVYYEVLEDRVNIRLEGFNSILLNEQETLITERFNTEQKTYLKDFFDLVEDVDAFDTDRYLNIVNEIASNINVLSDDSIRYIIQVSQYIPDISKDDINSVYKAYCESGNARYATKELFEEWNYIDAPVSTQMDAYYVIEALLEAENEIYANGKKVNTDSKNDKKDDKKESKENKKGLMDKVIEKADKLSTDLKIFGKGVKEKLKDAGSKASELSNNLDYSFNVLAKGIKDSLTNNRREAIIKGSVIPSFSRCIKLGIALAGITAINPIAGAVAAIGGLAASKQLNKKERILLMDEIETEIEVINKELEHCGDGETKKYRALLSQKKNLQRQYQRIKYNMIFKKDLVSGSSEGLSDALK